jgi:hypothetical protein
MGDTLSPRLCARISGVLYLLIIAAGVFAQLVVRDGVIVRGDAAATAGNITSHAFIFRLGIAADLSTYVMAVGVTTILYVLLRPVNRLAALLMLGFNLVQDAVGGLNALNAYRPLQLLGAADYLNVFSRSQLEAMAMVSLSAHSPGFATALLFFGCSCFALGYLTFTSGLFPKALGILMAIAGGCYLINSAAVLLSPRLASMLFPTILVPAFIGELSFALWLIVKGVDETRWREIARPSIASS